MKHTITLFVVTLLVVLAHSYAYAQAAQPPEVSESPAEPPEPAEVEPADEADKAAENADGRPEQPAMPDPESLDPVEAAGQIVVDVKSGNWRMVAAGVLSLVMFALARIRGKFRWTRGDRGGAILVMGLSLAGGLATALSTGVSLDWRLLVGVLGAAWTAVGGYTWAKQLIWPRDAQA